MASISPVAIAGIDSAIVASVAETVLAVGTVSVIVAVTATAAVGTVADSEPAFEVAFEAVAAIAIVTAFGVVDRQFPDDALTNHLKMILSAVLAEQS